MGKMEDVNSAPAPTEAETNEKLAAAASINADAETIYNYHRLNHAMQKSDAIFVLCSLDIRVATRAVQLYRAGWAPLVIFSGNVGAVTQGRFSGPEAAVFAEVARNLGVPNAAIIVEPRSKNTGENVRFTHALLEAKGIRLRSLILVQKPYMERRTYATFLRQWPSILQGEEIDIRVTSPVLEWAEYPNGFNPRDLVISLMVGDLVRIRDYPAKGYQIPQDIPDDVWKAVKRLAAAGFDEYLPMP